MVVTYKNNRVVPVIIIAACFTLFYCLIDLSVVRFGTFGKYLSTSEAESSREPSTTPSPHEPEPTPDLTGDDVLLIMKTGGTTIYRRLLMHLLTSLSPERINPKNVVIYSDYAETVAGFTTIDILANLTADAQETNTEFDVYREVPQYVANNVYLEAAHIEGDDSGPAGGWVLDKYKFLPLIDHAGKNWPKARWYIYMEDDSYLFLTNVLKYLSAFDWTAPHYLGSYAFKDNATFAHGGSGFALSRGAWETSFGQNPTLVEDFKDYTRSHGCGDHILGRVLNEYGVHLGENGGDEQFTWGFNGLVHFRFPFRRANWCRPLLSWHKAHNRDVARYHQFEKGWDYQKPLLHGDFFTKMIAPDLDKRREWWDNMSSEFEITSATANSAPAPKTKYHAGLWADSWKSVDKCEAACESWDECMQWSFYDDLCRLDDKLIMGSGYAPTMSQRKTGLMVTSGWFVDRLKTWTC